MERSTENIYSRSQSNNSSFPILNNLYDFDLDSVSMCSYPSTVCESEFVAAEVKRYESDSINVQAKNSLERRNNQINLSINVINTGVSDQSKDTNFLNSKSPSELFPNKFDKLPKFEKPKKSRILKNLKVFTIALIITFAITTGVIIGVIFTNRSDGDDSKETTNLPEFSSTFASSESSSTTQTTQTESSTESETSTAFMTESTTEFLKPPFELVPKNEWNSSAKGKTQLRGAVDRIIILNTEFSGNDKCSDKQTCLKFMRQRQLKFVNKFVGGIFMENLPENFLISSDGTVYEGRGFSYEGQHSYDQGKTSYNNGAIGVSFIGDFSDIELTQSQRKAFEYFVEKFIEDGKIVKDYKLYHRNQLLGLEKDSLSETVTSWSNWKETPKIIRRNEWKAIARSGLSEFQEKLHNKVVISHSEGPNCFDLKTCSNILKRRQLSDKLIYGDIKHNFIFAGDDLVFEGRSFDLNYQAMTGIQILFLGNFTEIEPNQRLIDKLSIFLQFAIDLGKLSDNYLLYGERQLVKTTSPGDKLYEILQKYPFDKHFDFNVTEPAPCYIGCGLFPRI